MYDAPSDPPVAPETPPAESTSPVYGAPLPPLPPAPNPVSTAPVRKPHRKQDGERRAGVTVLLICLMSILAVSTLACLTIFALGLHIGEGENGGVTLWAGDFPMVTATPELFTPPPLPSTTPEPQHVVQPEQKPSDGSLLPEEIYTKVVPSVVGILCESELWGMSSGTGMIIRENGYILTNQHVVDKAKKITVVFPDGTEYTATKIGEDFQSDIAVIKIQKSGLTAVTFGRSESMVPGMRCYALGNPLGMTYQNSFTDGMISAINRDIRITDDYYGDLYMTVLQTNCAINSGNSGGPLINSRGEVIGITSSKVMGDFTENVEGLAFAIPIDTAIPIMNSLLEFGYVKGRPYIGITAAAIQANNDSGLPAGVLLESIDTNADAFKKGLKKGDVVTHVNGIAVSSVAEINKIKNGYQVGDTLTLTIYRSSNVFDVEILLTEAPVS